MLRKHSIAMNKKRYRLLSGIFFRCPALCHPKICIWIILRFSFAQYILCCFSAHRDCLHAIFLITTSTRKNSTSYSVRPCCHGSPLPDNYFRSDSCSLPFEIPPCFSTLFLFTIHITVNCNIVSENPGNLCIFLFSSHIRLSAMPVLLSICISCFS